MIEQPIFKLDAKFQKCKKLGGIAHWFAVELWSFTNWNQVISIFFKTIKLFEAEVLIIDYDLSIRNKINFYIINLPPFNLNSLVTVSNTD